METLHEGNDIRRAESSPDGLMLVDEKREKGRVNETRTASQIFRDRRDAPLCVEGRHQLPHPFD